MIPDLILAFFVASSIILAGALIVSGLNNRNKYRFLQENAPGLKVLENPSLFGGHSNLIINSKHNLFVIDDLLKKHGPTLGFYSDTRPAVVTADLDFIKTFTVDEQIHIDRTKVNLPTRELVDDCLMCAGGDQWMRLRKAIAPAFSAHKIKSPGVQSDVESIIKKLIGLIERRLEEAKEKRQEDFIEEDAEDICHRYALALVFTNFYKQPNVIDFEAKEDKYVRMIDSAGQRMVGSIFLKTVAAFPSMIPILEWLMYRFHEQGVLRKTIMGYIVKQTKMNFEAYRQMREQQRLQKAADNSENFTLKDGSKFRRNMIDYITDQHREGKLTKREYFHSTFFLFFAADKTTTDALARLLYELARHPEVQAKLRDSILAHGTESEYLTWVIHEILRMYPPAATGASRTLARDIQTKHGLVPAGTFVLTATYTIGRLKEYWGEDAEEFRPERWANAKSFHPCQFLAFGGGRRACPGRELALMEIKMLLDVLLRKFKFEQSKVHTIDNSKLMNAPMFFTLVFDTPTFVRISRL